MGNAEGALDAIDRIVSDGTVAGKTVLPGPYGPDSGFGAGTGSRR